MSDSSPCELHHARPPCPSPPPRVHANPCSLSRWCHPAISSSVNPSQHQGLFKWGKLEKTVILVILSIPTHERRLSVYLLIDIWYFQFCSFCHRDVIFLVRFIPTWSFQVVLVVKNPRASAGDTRAAGSVPGWGRFPGGGMATHSSILAWRIPWTEEPGGLQSIGSQGVGHDWSNLAHMHT